MQIQAHLEKLQYLIFLIVRAQSKGTLTDGKLMREISYTPLEINQKLKIEGATTIKLEQRRDFTNTRENHLRTISL
jgi:hypothetical protein